METLSPGLASIQCQTRCIFTSIIRHSHLFRYNCRLICCVSRRIQLRGKAALLQPWARQCSNLHSWPFHWDKPSQSHYCLHNQPNHPSAEEQFSLVCFCLFTGLLCFCSFSNGPAIQELHLELGIPCFFPVPMKHQLTHTTLFLRWCSFSMQIDGALCQHC